MRRGEEVAALDRSCPRLPDGVGGFGYDTKSECQRFVLERGGWHRAIRAIADEPTRERAGKEADRGGSPKSDGVPVRRALGARVRSVEVLPVCSASMLSSVSMRSRS